MVGRAARGNPWIFREINEYFNNGRIIDRPTPIEVKEVIMRHCDALIEYKDELAGMREMRKHVAWYVQGMHNATLIRQKVNYIEKREELFELLENELR
jgi:tRNA-dihydrouridine synthase